MSWNREVAEFWSLCLSGCHFCVVHNETHIDGLGPIEKPNKKKCLQHNTTHQREANVIGTNSVIRSVVIHFQYLIIILSPTNSRRSSYYTSKQSLITIWGLKKEELVCVLVSGAPWVWRGRRRNRNWGGNRNRNRVRVRVRWWCLRNLPIPTSCCLRRKMELERNEEGIKWKKENSIIELGGSFLCLEVPLFHNK